MHTSYYDMGKKHWSKALSLTLQWFSRDSDLSPTSKTRHLALLPIFSFSHLEMHSPMELKFSSTCLAPMLSLALALAHTASSFGDATPLHLTAEPSEPLSMVVTNTRNLPQKPPFHGCSLHKIFKTHEPKSSIPCYKDVKDVHDSSIPFSPVFKSLATLPKFYCTALNCY